MIGRHPPTHLMPGATLGGVSACQPAAPVRLARVGDVVLAWGASRTAGAEPVPGIVTRVWGQPDGHGKPALVNLTIFPDMAAPENRTSVYLVAGEAEVAAEQLKYTGHTLLIACHKP